MCCPCGNATPHLLTPTATRHRGTSGFVYIVIPYVVTKAVKGHLTRFLQQQTRVAPGDGEQLRQKVYLLHFLVHRTRRPLMECVLCCVVDVVCGCVMTGGRLVVCG